MPQVWSKANRPATGDFAVFVLNASVRLCGMLRLPCNMQPLRDSPVLRRSQIPDHKILQDFLPFMRTCGVAFASGVLCECFSTRSDFFGEAILYGRVTADHAPQRYSEPTMDRIHSPGGPCGRSIVNFDAAARSYVVQAEVTEALVKAYSAGFDPDRQNVLGGHRQERRSASLRCGASTGSRIRRMPANGWVRVVFVRRGAAGEGTSFVGRICQPAPAPAPH